MKKLLVFVAVAISLTGCAAGQKTVYDKGETEFNPFLVDSKMRIYIGVSDERPYVLSGDKGADFTGQVRSLYGIPYTRVTSSGKPLAIDLTSLLVRSYARFGNKMGRLILTDGEKINNQVALKVEEGSVGLIYRLKEWKTDSMHREKFVFDVSLHVYNSRGEVLGSSSVGGSELINQSYPLASSIKKLMDQLSSSSEVQVALAKVVEGVATEAENTFLVEGGSSLPDIELTPKESLQQAPVAEQNAANTGGEAIELALWNEVKDSSDVNLLGAYLEKFPNGFFADVARIKIGSLRDASDRGGRLGGQSNGLEGTWRGLMSFSSTFLSEIEIQVSALENDSHSIFVSRTGGVAGMDGMPECKGFKGQLRYDSNKSYRIIFDKPRCTFTGNLQLKGDRLSGSVRVRNGKKARFFIEKAAATD